MSTWTYRFVKLNDGTINLYKVFNDDEGRPTSRLETPFSTPSIASMDDVGEIIEDLRFALQCAEKQESLLDSDLSQTTIQAAN